MTRPEALAFVVAPMPAGMARKIVRETLLSWPEADVAEWHRMKDRERKATKRAEDDSASPGIPGGSTFVRSEQNNGTGQIPVGIEDGDRTNSGSVFSKGPESVPPSPSPSPTPPSPPAPSPVHVNAREPKPKVLKVDAVPIPEVLAAVERFAETWAKFIENRRLIGEPMTHLAAEQRLKTFAERPQYAVAGLEMAIDNQWQGFMWKWFDKQNLPDIAHRNGTNGQRPPAPDFRAGIDPAAFDRWLRATYPRAKADLTLASANADLVSEYSHAQR